MRKINPKILAWAIGVFAISTIIGLVITMYGSYTLKIWLLPMFASLSSVSGIALLWEVIAKKSFSDDLFKQNNMIIELSNAGIEKFAYFHNDIELSKEIEATESLTIFYNYASTIRKNYKNKLGKKKLVVYMPDLTNSFLVDTLDYRFRKNTPTKPSVKNKIFEAIREFRSLGATIHLHQLISTHIIILTDTKCIVSTYTHPSEPEQGLVIKAQKQGTVYSFALNEIERLKNSSRILSDEEFKKIEDSI